MTPDPVDANDEAVNRSEARHARANALQISYLQEALAKRRAAPSTPEPQGPEGDAAHG